ncbi:hypothetical protein CHGG_10622 [Chaetomium globosum CBS 148.51]|uniref:Uncharacterized protein n=1 Tax=Chaetomium globosum (strain ATCC 6205 / CBS 148.51 / DSM 1962 / NBRC 6347 / NRRL 1970) TaxID=306901 RepID=Q2GN32_CHAGB|nr:uncharacterized protein CHGG_10622 [Chaetomium globosum CBS 148.51]EAQ84218.1 hypothetical protein CHGG_10622 [Chaetomium globosum CBS 148.51]
MSRLLPLRHALPRTLSRTTTPRTPPRTPTSSPSARLASSFLQTGPSPPRLPADQQAEFERLQRAAEAALSSHTTIPASASSASAPPSDPLTTSRHVSTPSGAQTQNSNTNRSDCDCGGDGDRRAGPERGQFQRRDAQGRAARVCRRQEPGDGRGGRAEE